MKLMKRILPLTLALTLPLCALAEDDSHRWVEDITKMKTVPPANATRLDAGFTRISINHSADVAAAALAWAETDILHGGVHEALAGDLSLFVMQAEGSWHVSISHGGDTAIVTLDTQGRLLRYQSENAPAMPAYNGVLPVGTDDAVLSYIEHLARMNGCTSVTDYERLSCQWEGGYDARVTARAKLDGVPCTFTLSLATMAFTDVDCPLPGVIVVSEAAKMAMATPVPAASETFHVTLGSQTTAVHATDRRTLGDHFSHWPEDALPREEVFAIALQALMDEFGLTLEDVTAEPFLYGYNAESSVHRWQLDFASVSGPMEGYEYTVYVRDSDGAVMGVWGPDEANG